MAIWTSSKSKLKLIGKFDWTDVDETHLHLFQKTITLIVKNGLDQKKIAGATFTAKSEDGTIRKGISDSNGKIELGPFGGRDIVTVKVEKLDSDTKYDIWNEPISMQTLQSQVQVTLNPTVCFCFVFEFWIHGTYKRCIYFFDNDHGAV